MIGTSESRRGQALAEFALVVPIIVLLIVGFVEVGRAVSAYNTVANAARQGARVAAVNQLDPSPPVTDCDESRPIEDPANAHWTIRSCAAVAASSLGVQASAVTVSYAAPPGTSLACSAPGGLHVGCIASVRVAYTYSISTPFVSTLIGPINMSSTSTMPLERVFP